MKETRFKDTEIGRIPEDWEVSYIEDVCYVNTGSKNTQDKVDNGKYPFFVRSQEIERINCFSYNCEAVLTAGDGVGTGKVFHYINGKFEVHQRVYIMTNFSDCIDGKYFYRYFVQNFYNRISQMTAKSSVDSVRKDMITKMIICIPPIAEQSRIASALTSIDNLISSFDKLIEKKKKIKQATMQQLLTGKKRLKGFTEPWVEKQLGKVGYTFSGLTGKTKEDFGNGNAKYITFLNILNNPVLKSELFEKVMVKDDERQNSCHKGDLFFNTSSETPEEVGICAMLDTEMESLYLNSFCFGYRLNDNNIAPKYLAYYFRSYEGRKLMTLLAQGVTRYNMSKSAFNNAHILIPPTKSEQNAIVEVLKCMDENIEAISIKKSKYEQIKQGMMQQLLTGQIRLKS